MCGWQLIVIIAYASGYLTMADTGLAFSVLMILLTGTNHLTI